jgi:hypothetical protein
MRGEGKDKNEAIQNLAPNIAERVQARDHIPI